jgi:hypothetical protein
VILSNACLFGMLDIITCLLGMKFICVMSLCTRSIWIETPSANVEHALLVNLVDAESIQDKNHNTLSVCM